MGLETFTGWIKDLVSTNPTGTDPKSEGDDHLRGLKSTLKTQFSGFTEGVAITAKESQLNRAGQYANSLWRRNLLINGSLEVWQRGTSFAGVLNGGYTADRWKVAAVYSGGGVDVSKDAGPNQQLFNSIKMLHQGAPATGVTRYALRQAIEKNLVRALGASTFTVSFWYRSNLTGTHGVDYDAGLGGAGFTGTVSGAATFTVNVAGAWEYKTVTLPISITGNGTNGENELGMNINIGPVVNGVPRNTISVGDYFNLSGVQLEAGSIATGFEHISLGETFSRCQRYYEAVGVVATAEGALFQSVFYKVTKRNLPTLALKLGDVSPAVLNSRSNDYFSIDGLAAANNALIVHAESEM